MKRLDKGWKAEITKMEGNLGWIYFSLYALVFPYLMGIVQKSMDENWELLPIESAFYYQVILVIILFLLFGDLMKRGLGLFLENMPRNLAAIVTGFGITAATYLLVFWIPLPVENPYRDIYSQQFLVFPQMTMLLLVVLMPLVQEVLFRGLLFGGIRQKKRWLAYALSVGFFAFFQVQQYAFVPNDANLSYLWLSVKYIPMGLGLSWCYDMAGSLWASVLLHMLLAMVQLFANVL